MPNLAVRFVDITPWFTVVGFARIPMKLCEDQRTYVRAHAAAAIGVLGPQYRGDVEQTLQAAWEDPAGEVRIAAAGALSAVDGRLERAAEVLPDT